MLTSILFSHYFYMNIKSFIFLICYLASSQASSLPSSANRLLQSTSRTSTVDNLCIGYPSRSSLIDNQSKVEADAKMEVVRSAMGGLSGNDLINRIISSNFSWEAEAKTLGGPAAGYVGPFLAGLIIIILISPFLLCCCCCPNCCLAKCCQKSTPGPYGKCELIWPAIILILAFQVIIVASSVGLTRVPDLQSSYNTLSCSLAFTLNDVLNGQVSTSNTRFIGFNNLVADLSQLQANIGQVTTQLNNIKTSNVSSPITLAFNQGVKFLDKISQIPNSTVDGVMQSFGYKNFDGTGNSSSVISILPTFLGTTAVPPSGNVGISWTIIKQINQNLKKIGENAQIFSQQTSGASVQIRQVSDSLSSTVTTISDLNTQLDKYDKQIKYIVQNTTLALTIVLASLVVMGLLGIFGSILMSFFEKLRCRYLLYAISCILWFLGIIFFVLAIFLSIATPALYFGCDYINFTLSNKNNFNANFAKLNYNPQLSAYLSVCLPGGSGDFINQFKSLNLTAINSFTSVVTSVINYAAPAILKGVEITFNNLESKVDDYYYTKVYDFSSPSNQNIINSLSDPTKFPNCTQNGFSQDYWVPNIQRFPNGCPSSASNATSVNCPTSAQIKAGRSNAGGSCFGCMDTMKVLLNSGVGATSNEVAIDLTARYNSPMCLSWVTQMKTLWNEYNYVKKIQYSPVRTRIASAKVQYTTANTGYKARVTNVGTAFFNISEKFKKIISSVVDPNYGLVAGLNCLPLGEDFILISNAICVKPFNILYIFRLTLGIIAFAILFSLCCITCSGVRSYKQQQFKKYTVRKQNKGYFESAENLQYKL